MSGKRTDKTNGNYNCRRDLVRAVKSRYAKGYTQYQIADIVGVSQPTVMRILQEDLSDIDKLPSLGSTQKPLSVREQFDAMWKVTS